LAGVRALDVNLPHVRDVEDAAVGAHGAVLRGHPLVLHRHFPARERDEARSRRDVALVERRAQERLHAGDSTESQMNDAPARWPGRRTGSPWSAGQPTWRA